VSKIRINLKKQSQFAGRWPEIRNELNGCDLKKQSQFAGLWPEIRSSKYEIRNKGILQNTI